MTPDEFEELLRRELEEAAPPPAPTRRERPVPPDVQRDLDRLLGSLQRELEGGRPASADSGQDSYPLYQDNQSG